MKEKTFKILVVKDEILRASTGTSVWEPRKGPSLAEWLRHNIPEANLYAGACLGQNLLAGSLPQGESEWCIDEDKIPRRV